MVMDRVSSKLVRRGLEEVLPIGEEGTPLEEIRQEPKEVLTPDIAPLIAQKAVELVGCVRTTEEMRLNIPTALDPFEATVTGLRFDAVHANEVVERFSNEKARAIADALQVPVEGISDRKTLHMRASLAREHNMIALLKDWLLMVEEINGRMIGGQEG